MSVYSTPSHLGQANHFNFNILLDPNMIKTAFPKTQTQIINSQQQLPFCFSSPGLDKREDTTDYHSLGTVLALKTPYDEVLRWTCDMKKRQWVEHQHNFKFRIISYKVTSNKYEYVGPWWLMMFYSYCSHYVVPLNHSPHNVSYHIPQSTVRRPRFVRCELRWLYQCSHCCQVNR